MTEFVTYQKSLYDKRRREIRSDIIFGVLMSIALLIIAVLVFISNFVLVKVYIKGRSMYPTLKDGDVVVLSTYRAPEYGDIIVISGEKTNGDWLIKRAIAFEGDTVKIEGGYVYLKKEGATEFTKLDEPYLVNKGITYYPTVNNSHDILPAVFCVGENEIFYLGDNRTDSSDSRSGFGNCTSDQVVGVVSDFAMRTKGINTFFTNVASYINGIFG